MTIDHRKTVLITARELDAQLAAGRAPVLLDIGGVRPGRGDARSTGLPGAVPVDLATELAGPGGGTLGNRPLPEIAELEANARRWGIREGAAVVVYDDNNGLQAARAWWVLRWAGIDNVRLLDGGLGSWRAAGYATAELTSVPDLGNVQLSPGHLPVLDADAAALQPHRGVLLDARDAPAYETSGHIPGALNAPARGNLSAAGTFAAPEALRLRFAALGALGADVGVSCGAGVSAAHDILALATLGQPAALFVGSWSAWSADPSRPVVTGPTPG